MRQVKRVLIVTTEWPRYSHDMSGIHVVQQVARLREYGLEIDVFSFRGKKNPLRYLWAVRNFLGRDLGGYDLIHAHHGQSGLVALAQRHLPVVVTFHGSDLQGIRDRQGDITLLGRVLRATSRFVAHKADEVIVVAEHLSRCLPGISSHVIPAGIDLDLFRDIPKDEARRALALPTEKPLVLFVGNPLRTEKRFGLAEESITLLSQHIDAELIVADEIPHNRIPLYMNACDLMLVTSSSEGSPSTVKEALACNLGIVSTDVGDISSQITSVPGCAICKDAQPATLAHAMFRILANMPLVDGRSQVAHLDERVLVQNVVDVYNEAVSRAELRLAASSSPAGEAEP